jgi:hypothetical protein
MPGKIVATMRKRKGIKVDVPGVENVSQPTSNCYEIDANVCSTTTSYRGKVSKALDFLVSRPRCEGQLWACS